MTSRILLLLALLTGPVGCQSDVDEGPCVVLVDGPWVLTGSSIGHSMFGTLVFDEDTCSFEFSDWNMAMDIATGGTVDDFTVTFSGDEAGRDWTLCFGPVLSETSAKAKCDDGAILTMNYDG